MFLTPAALPNLNRKQQLRRQRGLLYVACNWIYLQSDDNIIISIGRPFLNFRGYYGVLLPTEVRGEVVLGYMSQGYVRERPDGNGPRGDRFIRAEMEAACVHMNWVYAHMLLRPNPGINHVDFKEAVGLTRRAADTLCEVSFAIGKNALELAEKLRMAGSIAAADASAKAALVEENPLQVSVLWVPRDFHNIKNLLPQEEKNEARYAFEATVMEVFSFHLCIGSERWYSVNDITINTTGMRKRFADMTPEERVASGAVKLEHIIRNLKLKPKFRQAILDALTASRALARIAWKLKVACDKVEAV